MVSQIRASAGNASLVVGLQYPPEATTSRQVEITSVISRFWLIR